MAGDAADAAAATGSGAGEVDVRVIGFRAPEREVSASDRVLILCEKRKIEIAVKDVAAGQGDIFFQIER